MLVGLPSTLRFPFAYLRRVSQRFWDLGARPVEEPVLTLNPPKSAAQTWVNPGYWKRDGRRRTPKQGEQQAKPAAIPMRGNCSLQDPDEAFLWMWVALPGMRGAPMLLSEAQHRMDSRRLWDLGARPVEDPILEYVPPTMAQPDWATSAGRWVPVGSITAEERSRREIAAGIARLGNQQRYELSTALHADASGGGLPDTKAAMVVRGLSPLEKKLMREMLDDAA